jgi:hypothetical protein
MKLIVFADEGYYSQITVCHHGWSAQCHHILKRSGIYLISSALQVCYGPVQTVQCLPKDKPPTKSTSTPKTDKLHNAQSNQR